MRRTSAKCALYQPKNLFTDAHGEVKVNCWEAPTEIARWKEEHVRQYCIINSCLAWVTAVDCLAQILGDFLMSRPEGLKRMQVHLPDDGPF